MSTRSTIGLLTEDGQIKSIYCHSDGYPSYMGELLKNNYATREQIEKILAEGDCSFLDSTIETSRFYNSWRGEDTEAILWSNEDGWITWAGSAGLEFLYLFNGFQWIVREI